MTQLLERKPRTLVVDGEVLQVRVRESIKARTSRIIVGPKRPLEIIVPHGVSDAEIDRMLNDRRAWIQAKTTRAMEIANRPAHLGLSLPGAVPIAGESVQVERLNGARAVAQLRDGHLVVRGPAESVGEALLRWYRREARRRTREAVEREAARLDLVYKSVAIRDQRTRWGSCSRAGNLSFNWRLLLAPPAVLDYVVVHELCHLREPNHSKAFWRALDAAMPGWPDHARWLRAYGHELHGFELDLQPWALD